MQLLCVNWTKYHVQYFRSHGFLVFKWSGFCCNGYSYSPIHLNTGPFKIRNILSGFQMIGLSDFRSHSKSKPFATQPLFDHSKSILVWISDSHCIQIKTSNGQIVCYSDHDLKTKQIFLSVTLCSCNKYRLYYLTFKLLLYDHPM